MERYVAIDNVCAWPNLIKFCDMYITALIFNQPCHGQWEGDIECWSSTDGGRIWNRKSVCAPHDPGINRMHVAAGIGNNGRFVAISTGWGPVPEKGKRDEKYLRKLSKPLVCISEDRGSSWKWSGGVELPVGISNLVPFGNIIRTSEGILGASFYHHPDWNDEGIYPPENRKNYFLRSYDNGITWVNPVDISSDDHNETALLCMNDDTFLSVSRTWNEKRIDLLISKDIGNNWKFMDSVTMPGEHPANLLHLNDGRILLTYGIRAGKSYGIGARIFKDNLISWSESVVLASFDGICDCGYPSSVQMDDGTIVTAYYCSGINEHNRYHMGVLRWNAEEFDALRV